MKEALYADDIMRNARLDEAQAGIKIAGRNSNNLRYANNTTLMAESEELKSLLMKVKEESEKASLKLNIQKTKIMASGPITSWQIDGETVETVSDFIFLGSKITADADCSLEIKRRLRASLVAQTVKRLPAIQDTGYDSWVGKIPWRSKWHTTPALLPGKSHGQRSLIGYSPWDREESDTTERLHFHSLEAKL